MLFFAEVFKFVAMLLRTHQTSRPARGGTLAQEGLRIKPLSPVNWFSAFRLFLIPALLVGFLIHAFAGEGLRATAVVRNAAWNDLLDQLDAGRGSAPNDSVAAELFLIQKFLKEHQTEANVGVYDVTVFRAIDQARAHLQKADKDLEIIREALRYKEFQARNVR